MERLFQRSFKLTQYHTIGHTGGTFMGGKHQHFTRHFPKAGMNSDLNCSNPWIEFFAWLGYVKWPTCSGAGECRKLANWGEYPIHKKGGRRERITYKGISLFTLPGKVYSKCLETDPAK